MINPVSAQFKRFNVYPPKFIREVRYASQGEERTTARRAEVEAVMALVAHIRKHGCRMSVIPRITANKLMKTVKPRLSSRVLGDGSGALGCYHSGRQRILTQEIT